MKVGKPIKTMAVVVAWLAFAFAVIGCANPQEQERAGATGGEDAKKAKDHGLSPLTSLLSRARGSNRALTRNSQRALPVRQLGPKSGQDSTVADALTLASRAEATYLSAPLAAQVSCF